MAVGLPVAPVPVDIATCTTRQARIESVFRYANQYDRVVEARPDDVKLQILVDWNSRAA